MANPKSKYDTRLTLKYITTERENIIFDRKSAMCKPSQLAEDISAFANAEGGAIIIGINDNGELDGINNLSTDKLNNLIDAPRSACKPMPKYDYEFMPIVNKEGKEDRLLLLHIQSAHKVIIRTTKDDTFLRIGDRSVPMKGDNLRQLEYQKQLQKFEEELCDYASVADLDQDLITQYKESIDASSIPTEQVLEARGMIRQGKLTHAAVLLFAKNVRQFYQNCRVRFIRYEGDSALQGTKLNIVKDKIIEAPILKLIDQAKSFIGTP